MKFAKFCAAVVSFKMFDVIPMVLSIREFRDTTDMILATMLMLAVWLVLSAAMWALASIEKAG